LVIAPHCRGNAGTSGLAQLEDSRRPAPSKSDDSNLGGCLSGLSPAYLINDGYIIDVVKNIVNTQNSVAIRGHICYAVVVVVI
jgi:hypothetical protein